MKLLEYFGVMLAAVGFLSLSFNEPLTGFILGLLSCFCLLPVFWFEGLRGVFALQCFFLCANIIGILNNI